MSLRRVSSLLETLPALRFCVLVGAVEGVLAGVPRLATPGDGGSHIATVLLFWFSAVIYWAAAWLFMWIAVRRRRWSVWSTAAQVTIGAALSDVVEVGLGVAGESFKTQGKLAEFVAREPMSFVESNLSLILLRGAMWFIGSLLIVAIGRAVAGDVNPVVNVHRVDF